jgi:hypothetical protein
VSCSTCFPTTQFAWVPSLSDKTQDEVIETVGCMACTVCWPAAPRHPKFIAMEKQRAAEQKAKDDALCEGSGKYVADASGGRYYSYGRCPACGALVTRTSTGKLRKHKTPLQEKIEAQQKDAAKITGNAKAFNRLHTAALKVNDAIHLLDEGDRAISAAWMNEQITSTTRESLEDLLKARQKKAAAVS